MKSLTVTVENKTQALRFLRWAQKQWPEAGISTKYIRNSYHGKNSYPTGIEVPSYWAYGFIFNSIDAIPFADFKAKYLRGN